VSAARLDLVSSSPLRDVWRGQDLARQEKVVASGFAALDAELPGGGWPVGSLVEVMQARPGQHAWRLLLPALAQAAQAQRGPVVLVAAPFEPFAPGLQAQGLPSQQLLRVQADKPAARLWAAEQALHCADVVAVLAWLPQAHANELRRLHMAAQQHAKLLFVFRGLDARQDSCARLRLAVEGARAMEVRFLKRRGPPLLQPLRLPAHPPRLQALLDARKGRPSSIVSIQPGSRSHVLDRTAALA
jgi:protein ImuA